MEPRARLPPSWMAVVAVLSLGVSATLGCDCEYRRDLPKGTVRRVSGSGQPKYLREGAWRVGRAPTNHASLRRGMPTLGFAGASLGMVLFSSMDEATPRTPTVQCSRLSDPYYSLK